MCYIVVFVVDRSIRNILTYICSYRSDNLKIPKGLTCYVAHQPFTRYLIDTRVHDISIMKLS